MDTIPWGVFFTAAVVVLVIAMDAGYRLGHAVRRRSEDEKESVVSIKTGAVLSLLAFILVFTFGIVASRYETRKALVREEANIIGTTYLRSDFLPEPDRSQAREILKQYVDLRVAIVQSKNVEYFQKGLIETNRLQNKLWEMAVVNARRDMNSDVAALYIESLNQMIDIHAERVVVGWQTRIPGGIWLVLFILTFFGMAGMGYQTAIAGSTRKSGATPLLIISFSLVLTLIALLDNPKSTFITVSQQPLVNVRNSMQASPELRSDFGDKP
jgi:hypothetical protein